MKQAVVFDLGNVLVRFCPDFFLNKIFTDQKVIEACKKLYFTDLWNQFDQGLVTKEDLIEIGLKTYPNYRLEFEKMFASWFAYVQPIPSSMDVLETLKQRGVFIYFLSNIPKDCFDYFTKTYAWFKADKGVFSFAEKLCKPDLKIYQLLIDRYQLNPKDCVFVDDRLENIEAAKQLGFSVVHCTDVTKLSEELYEKIK